MAATSGVGVGEGGEAARGVTAALDSVVGPVLDAGTALGLDPAQPAGASSMISVTDVNRDRSNMLSYSFPDKCWRPVVTTA